MKLLNYMEEAAQRTLEELLLEPANQQSEFKRGSKT